jgi:arylsulfate sulfotransferase
MSNVFQNSWFRISLVAASFFISAAAQAVTIIAGPTLSTNTSAPLAANLQLTTDVPSRVSVTADDGTNSWRRNFYDFDTVHSIPLLGFKPGRSYTISVEVSDSQGNTDETASPLHFTTGPLPSTFVPITVLKSTPEKMEPGYTLFRALNGLSGTAYVVVVDNTGTVVWYSSIPSNFGVKRLENGNLLYPLPTRFEEINMLGQTNRIWLLRSNLGYNHEATITDKGTVLYLSDATRVVTNFPTSSSTPNAPRVTTNIWHNPVVEMSLFNGQVQNIWTPIDLLDPTRISYLTFSARNPVYGWDWSHANAVIEDPRDNSLIVSIRHQNAVIKFSRDGQLKWILGPPENWGSEFQPYLLTPVGHPFEWQYAQHAPIITPRGTLLLFDNGNFRASPFDSSVPDAQNYSRAVEYDIDEVNMRVSQVWDWGRTGTNHIYAASRGSAKWMPETGNVLITFADVKYVNGLRPSTNAPNASMERMIEVTHGLGEPPYSPSEVVLDLALFDYTNKSSFYAGSSGYRAERIPDLYPVNTVYDGLQKLLTSVEATEVVNGEALFDDLLNGLDGYLEGDTNTLTEQLGIFQAHVQLLVEPGQPELAGQFTLLAQSIKDAVGNGEISWPGIVAPDFGTMQATRGNGKVSLNFTAASSRIYLIESSSDLVTWDRLGVAKLSGTGQFTFDDNGAAGQSVRFYRVIDPLGTVP